MRSFNGTTLGCRVGGLRRCEGCVMLEVQTGTTVSAGGLRPPDPPPCLVPSDASIVICLAIRRCTREANPPVRKSGN